MLLTLQGLHIYWGYLIFKILKRFVFLKVRKNLIKLAILLSEVVYAVKHLKEIEIFLSPCI